LNSLGHISTADFATSLPGALIQALMSDSRTRVLQRPQLRATDGGKASLKIGSKIPYVSGSLNSAVATPGSIPYATTQFQQIDVGTNLDLEPHVNGPNDISMHVKVEISEVTQQINIGGINEPEIGQTVNEAVIRLKDGEVSVLGGLTDRSDQLSTSGIPGLVNMPVLGYLFGARTKQQNEQEILITLIPHIIRSPDLTALGEAPIETGTENNVRVLRSIPSSASITISPGQEPAPARPQSTPQKPVPPATVPNPPAILQRPAPTGPSSPGGTPAAGAAPPSKQ
jgi:general secretion pathway protein D